MKIEEERKAFEEWYEQHHNGRQISCDWVELDKSYSSGYGNALWVGWLASANRQGYKLVPVCKHEWSIQLSGRFICDLCGEFMDTKQ